MLRLALVLPINRKSEVLLQHRTADAPIKPNYWAFFGGHIESGETPIHAAKREFKEELQIDPNHFRFHFFKHCIFYGEEGGDVERYFFIIHLDKDPNSLKKLQLEGDDLGYFNYESLDYLIISENDRKMLDTLYERGLLA